MQRWLGTGLILVGVAVLVLDADRWDVTVVSVSRGHGIHLSDLIGLALVLSGIVALWRAAPAER